MIAILRFPCPPDISFSASISARDLKFASGTQLYKTCIWRYVYKGMAHTRGIPYAPFSIIMKPTKNNANSNHMYDTTATIWTFYAINNNEYLAAGHKACGKDLLFPIFSIISWKQCLKNSFEYVLLYIPGNILKKFLIISGSFLENILYYALQLHSCC